MRIFLKVRKLAKNRLRIATHRLVGGKQSKLKSDRDGARPRPRTISIEKLARQQISFVTMEAVALTSCEEN